MINADTRDKLIRMTFYCLLFFLTYFALNFAKESDKESGMDDITAIESVSDATGGLEVIDQNYQSFEKVYYLEHKSVKVEEEKEVTEVYYTVKRGDTLYEIAKAIGQDIDVLIANNPKVKNGKIYVDQKIKVLSENGIYYKVIKGDSLVKIANKFKVELGDIIKDNKLQDTRILAGQKLFLKNPNLDYAINSRKSSRTNVNTFKSTLRWPIKWSGVTSSFGNRFHPVLKRYVLHRGVDLRAGVGVTLYAPNSGKVTIARTMGGYGKIIEIKHSNGYTTRMAHLDKIYVKTGQRVSAGEIIGRTGRTGRITGPHLHFEIIKNGTPIDPMRFR